MQKLLLVVVATLGLVACATGPSDPGPQPPIDGPRGTLVGADKLGSAMGAVLGQGAIDLPSAFSEARKHPLGTQQNPVLVDMPAGEHRYLARLRCANGVAPAVSRAGSFGAGPYGSIIDGYEEKCVGSTPAQAMIFMDMYHDRFVETEAPSGFALAPQ